MSRAARESGLVLASASPRRRELLSGLGISFDVAPVDVDETPRAGEDPLAYVLRLADEKALRAAALFPGALALAADTSVVLDEEILGKPSGSSEAQAMLRRLSGRSHRVLTGVAVSGGGAPAHVAVETRVHFRPLSEEEIRWYVATGEPFDKAGGYGIQGRAGAFVRAIEGSASNVIGLPLAETLALLAGAGVALPWSGR